MLSFFEIVFDSYHPYRKPGFSPAVAAERIYMTNDMTNGKPAKLILLFTIPLLIGNIFQQFYSMADTIIVGRTIGVHALAAVGATGAISFLILGFVTGITSGFSVITAQRFGANDMQGVRRSVATSITLSTAVTVVLTAIAMLLTMPMLQMMNTPADIIQDSYNYIIVIFAGIFASVFYNLISSIIRALGDSRTPLLFLILASVLNILLDLVFILCFGMGVAGAAYATVIAQVVSGILCVIYSLKRFPLLHLHREDWRFDWSFAWAHLKIGLPMAFQFSITAIGVMVMQAALNSFGSVTVAGYTAASKIEQIVTAPFGSIGVAMATYGAQNFGAGKMHRIRSGTNAATLITVGFTALAVIVSLLLGTPLVHVFVSDGTPEVYSQAQVYLNIISGFYLVLGMLFIYRNVLQGIGKGLVPFLAGVIELIMRILIAFTLAAPLGYAGVCLANPAAWLGATIPLLIAYFVIMHKLAPRLDPPHLPYCSPD